MASVPLATEMQCRTPYAVANAASNSLTVVPPTKAVRSITDRNAASNSGWYFRYCAPRSTSGIFIDCLVFQDSNEPRWVPSVYSGNDKILGYHCPRTYHHVVRDRHR